MKNYLFNGTLFFELSLIYQTMFLMQIDENIVKFNGKFISSNEKLWSIEDFNQNLYHKYNDLSCSKKFTIIHEKF